MNPEKSVNKIILKLAGHYGLDRLKKILKDENSKLFSSDIYICLKGIVEASFSEKDTLLQLREAKNVYGAPVFAVDAGKNKFLIKNAPDIQKAIADMENYSFSFKLSPYHILNTFLAILEAQVTGFNLKELLGKGEKHIQDSIRDSLKRNPNWDEDNLKTEEPLLIMPVGAAGCGKSTFYRELSNVVNISCDNIRYLLFSRFGPCFSSWESCLSWWVVNFLTDRYLSRGYSVFYNGVNTDLQYRSPITMEDPDPLFKGIPYEVRIVYFEPPVELSPRELDELKSVNLWEKPIEEIDLNKYSDKVREILQMIKDNYLRTLSRTKDISSGKREQDPFDILYAVPAAVVKLFVEQSFDVPRGPNVIKVKRKEISDPEERAAFYRRYARKLSN